MFDGTTNFAATRDPAQMAGRERIHLERRKPDRPGPISSFNMTTLTHAINCAAGYSDSECTCAFNERRIIEELRAENALLKAKPKPVEADPEPRACHLKHHFDTEEQFIDALIAVYNRLPDHSEKCDCDLCHDKDIFKEFIDNV